MPCQTQRRQIQGRGFGTERPMATTFVAWFSSTDS